MANVKWKFVLAHSYGSMPSIGELYEARDKTLSLTLNKPGSMSFKLALDSKIGYDIWPIETCVKAYRNDRLIWSGPVWNLEESAAGTTSSFTVNCVGWLALLEKRILRSDLTYSAEVDDTQIVIDMIDMLNADTAVPLPQKVINGVTQYAPSRSWITEAVRFNNPDGSPYEPAMRGIPQPFKQFVTNVNSTIQQYSGIEDGFDFEVDPETRVLKLWRKKMKPTKAVFGLGWGPKNLAAVTRQFEPASMCNFMYAFGDPTAVPGFAPPASSASQELFGMFEETASLSNIKDNPTLNYFASEEVTLREYPRQIWSITPFPYRQDGNVPQIFEDYEIGDHITFVARQGRMNSGSNPQGARVFGGQINIDANNNETLSALQIYAG